MHRLRLARLQLRARGRLDAGRRVRVERGVQITVAPAAQVLLQDDCRLGEGCRIEAHGGTVRIGAGAFVGERAVIVAHTGIDVGAGSVIGDWALISDAAPTFDDPERPTRLQPIRAEPVRVGDGAHLGPHAAVLAGATVRAGAVVAPYEVVGSGP